MNTCMCGALDCEQCRGASAIDMAENGWPLGRWDEIQRTYGRYYLQARSIMAKGQRSMRNNGEALLACWELLLAIYGTADRDIPF